MNVFLWILQAVLALFFVMAAQKVILPKDKLVTRLPWVADFSQPTVRFIGIAEVAAALGLILPAATDIAPVLTPLAASGLAVIMVLAAITHARRKEPGAIAFNAVVLVLAVTVAWGRFGPYAF